MREDAPVRPVNVYGRSKAAGERLVLGARGHGLRTAVVRLSNVFGSIDDHADRVIPAFARAAAEGRPLRVCGRGHTFDFTPLEDAVRGLSALVELLEDGGPPPPPIHLVTGRATTLGELAATAVGIAGGRSPIVEAAPRSYDVARFVGDPGRARALLGWEARVGLADALGRMIGAFRERALAAQAAAPRWVAAGDAPAGPTRPTGTRGDGRLAAEGGEAGATASPREALAALLPGRAPADRPRPVPHGRVPQAGPPRHRRRARPFPTSTLAAKSRALIVGADRPFPGVDERREEEPNVVANGGRAPDLRKDAAGGPGGVPEGHPGHAPRRPARRDPPGRGAPGLNAGTGRAAPLRSFPDDPAPRIAVVVNTYDQARFLGEALESVFAQSHSADEVIVVDDGSGDAPETVAGRYPGVRLIRQPNMGLAAARNTGLNAATADLITFLDADDRLLPNALASGIAALAERPGCAFAFGGHRRVAADGTPLGGDVRPPSATGYLDLLWGNQIGMHAAVVYVRRLLAEAGGFDVSVAYGEDYELYLRLAQRYPIAVHPETVAEYRQHDENMSNNSAKMLSWILKIHNRQRAAASLDPGLADAWRQGQASWRNYYRAALRSAGSVALDDLPRLLASASLGDLDAFAPSATIRLRRGTPITG